MIAVLVITGVLSSVTLLGHGLMLGAVIRSRFVKLNANVFLINIAIADCLIALCTFVFLLLPITTDSSPLCIISAMVLLVLSGVSGISVLFLAIERYLRVCRRKWYRQVRKKVLILAVLIGIWVHSGVWAAQGVTGWTELHYAERTGLCLINPRVSISYDVTITFVFVILPAIVLMFCYTSIIVAADRSRRTMEKCESPRMKRFCSPAKMTYHKERWLKSTLVAAILLFVTCYGCVGGILLASYFIEPPYILQPLSVCLILTTSAGNAIIYSAMNHNVRRCYSRVFATLRKATVREEHQNDATGGILCEKNSKSSKSPTISQDKFSMEPVDIPSTSYTRSELPNCVAIH
ncbi:hypothetical protein CAPTEDRAFT_131802 [Capitella teleta]|uniref:G-protein coupled receptors family 1 profile domain-containing protein n=1 Tax=Capitella teleta TaxID=283909 RepID=R7UUZ0_CAPTE|nr:hypothetical protein CAPTEDRAFT_131802 [Capitella teleta]|eukprot:ELU10453.1 hypothetical protein CAPTEDRAFT_131802 [Capitella teleta]